MNKNNKDRLFDMMRKVNRLDENTFRGDDKINIINEFIDYAKKELELENTPKLNLIDKDGAAAEMKSFGCYNTGLMEITLVISNRNTADILRSLAHEMVHHKQNLEKRLNSDSGLTGSNEENEANAMAGVLLRNYGKINPKIFE